jgi:hypothetical protein
MKKIVLIILAIVVCFPAFAKKHKRKKKQKDTNEIISVALRHAGCFGRCRDYTIEINKNGLATYTATRFNQDSGVFTKNIGTAKAMEIINQFSAYRVDTCQDNYESRIPDLPGIVYTIKYENKTKRINDAKYGPPFLMQLSGQIDKVVQEPVDDSWKKVTPAGGK